MEVDEADDAGEVDGAWVEVGLGCRLVGMAVTGQT